MKRLLALIGGLLLFIVVTAFVYQLGMAGLEGKPRSFWHALLWAGETLSTTGYGSDSLWAHPVMVLFVVLIQFMGVFVIFLIVPIYLLPALEERFERRVPREAPPMVNGVLVFRYGPAVTDLIEQLKLAGQDTLIMESNEPVARRLMEEGHRVIFGDLASDPFAHVPVGDLQAIVANGDDGENAALTLSARQAGFRGEILALADEPMHRKPLTVAGADVVFTPRHILAAALAARASHRISPRVVGAQALGRVLVVHEIKLAPTSEMAGRTLAELDVGRRTGVNIIGQWRGGELRSPLSGHAKLEAGSILIVAGSSDAVTQFAESCTAGGARLGKPFFIAGYGEVGRTVARILTSVGEEVITLDREPIEGVDIVGDIANHELLEKSGLKDARAAIMAVGSDSATLFATLVVKEFTPEVPIIARVNEADNVERIHRAGADFALSLSQVSGQLLAGRILHRDTISVDPHLRVLESRPPHRFEGQRPADLDIRGRTGASIVAVDRGDELLIDLGKDFHFEAGDLLYVCGTDQATQRFLELFPPPSGANG